MKEIVFLLEEESAKALLDSMLPRFLSSDIAVRCIPFEGKQDLEKQIVKRLRGYKNPCSRFIILRDQDSSPNCTDVKERLKDLVREAGKAGMTLVRIACRELEAFYLADLEAVEVAIGVRGLAAQQGKAKYRDPDSSGNPSQELCQLTEGKYQKLNGSREIGKYISLENERSRSFKNLIAAIRRQERALLEIEC